MVNVVMLTVVIIIILLQHTVSYLAGLVYWSLSGGVHSSVVQSEYLALKSFCTIIFS
jgi:hypothetical protein